ncbi:glycoside hydrolase family 6 protein [Microtetraspora glauca]|uniref:Glycoside hydrolase family 6 protein n=1 Tax=Microtetraspora glauca TaxID=1996 RepID=A0ABV3GCG6_MICGL
MAPEQARGERVTPASDIFAWGALIAYAASGRAPFGDGSLPSVLYRIVHHEPDLTALEPALHAVVARALAKDPARRPTAQQLVDTLTGHTPTGDTPSGTAERPSSPPAEALPSPGTGSAVPVMRPDRSAYAESTGGTGRTDGTGGAHGAGDDGGTGATVVARRGTGALVGVGAAVVAIVTAGVIIAVRTPPADGDKGAQRQAISTTSPEASLGTPATAVNDDTSPDGGTDGEPGDTSNGANDGTKAGNPLGARTVRFYASPDNDAARQSSIWEASGRAGDAAVMRALAKVPQSVWLSGMSDSEAARVTDAALDVAAKQDAVPVFVTDSIPLRDCHSSGLRDSRAYSSWIGAIATAIGDRAAVVVLEPNSLSKVPGTPGCDLGGDKGEQARYDQLSEAVKRLGALPKTAVYLDGGQEYWPSLKNAATRLISSGLDKADGYYLNASGFQPTEQVEAYGAKLAKCVHVIAASGAGRCLDAEVDAVADDTAGLPHFVIDTSRNGTGEWEPRAGTYKDPQTWCNPPGRGMGIRPTTGTASRLADAYLWIRDPTKSNGTCTRGTSGPKDPAYGLVPPPGGAFWPVIALQRAKNAVPPLR